MATTELYYNTLKDKDQLDRSNPRTRASSGLSSSDHQYKNFLSGIKPKPRVKSNSDVTSTKQESKSFVESAARTQSVAESNRVNRNRNSNAGLKKKSEKEEQEEEAKAKAHKALYEQFSSVPHSKKVEASNKENKVYQNESASIKSSSEVDFTTLKQVQSESFGSVGRLRSLFDKNAADNAKPVQFRKNVSKKNDRPLSTGYIYQENKTEVSGIYEKQNSQEQRKSLDVDSLLSSEPVVNDNNDTNNDTGPTKKSPRKSSNSEFENFEDYIVPTGTKKIDVRSILAPVDTEKDDAVTMKIEKNEASNIRTKELDIQQILEIERMKRTQDDVSIEKRFNIKRRSLKERLSLLAAEDNDPFASMSSNNDNEGSKVSQQVLKHEKMEMAEDAIEPVHITDVKEENLSDLLDDKPDVNEPYKSAVERYDEFITEQDVSNDFYSPTSPIDTNFGIKQKPLPSTDLNQNFVDTKSNKKLEKTANANTDSDSANLMDSILQHMEKTDTSKSIGKDYISLLRSSSLTEADQEKPAVENRGYAPEVLPRLSKQLAHNHTTPVTPPVSEDEVTLSFQSSIKPAGSDTSDVNTSRATTECESEYTDTCSSSDEFQLPPPPAKSNLARDKSREGLRVIFRQEKLHDVIYTYGPTEYDRANADIDPIASSAEWELEKRVDNMDIFSVDLQKDERGLGLSIIGLGVGTESGVEKLGIFVKTLTEGGASQKDGRIQVNDQILEVNGVSLVGVTQYFAAQTLKGTNGIVRFLMGREKSRRRSYAPGAPLSNSPEMQKHVEEINKVLQQVEELEERAANSESTLDDVRDELLKAEERAHEAERQLQETKEQLKAVTESPFVGNQRKLKNEIKKKGGNKEKVDELQRNLKDVSNRLSASEENLLMLTSVKDNKDRELQELYELVEDHATNKKQVEESNHSLRNELNSKSDLINQLQAENGKMQLLLDEQKKLYVEEQTKFQNIEAQHIGKVAEEEEELKSKFFELENINESLREEVKRLQEQLKANKKLSVENESLKQSVLELSANQQKLAFTEEKLKESERLNGELKLEVETLTAKNEYLQSLITKLDISHGQTSAEKNDLEQQFKVKAEQDLKEKEELDKKIQELESRLTSSKPKYFSKIVAEEVSIKTELDVESTPDKFDKDTPVLPKREYVNINIAYPPMISRDSKPSDSKPVSPTSVESFNLEVFPVDTKISETANIQSSELIEEVIINDVETENPTINFNTKLSNSLSNSSIINPITKPPRGHFIDVDEDFVIVPTPTEETKEIITIVKENNFEQLEPSIDVTSLSTDADRKTPEVEVTTEHKFILENSSLVQQVSDSIITSAVTEASSPGVKKKSLENDVNKSVNSDKEKIKKDMHSKYLQESSKPLSPTLISIPDSIEFDNLTEDTVDNDSDSDEGQFQLIAEDIQDEQSTPDTLSKQSVEIETAKTSETDRSSFFQALNNEPNFNSWLDDEWKRLDSNTREQQAELIAAQVTARSPAKRKSSISSGSSDDENDEKVEEEEKKKDENWSRTQSIKIDSSYFEKSTLQDSFDNEMSILDEDQEIRDIDATDVGIVKSTSFDSAIPATQVLDNKIALEKRQLMKRDEKRKPTHGARGQLAEEIDTFQISTLPRNKKASVSTPNLLKNAASEPNLLQVSNSNGTIDKPEKQKHKFGFHIPKVFKKGKINAKKSLPNDVVSTSSTDEHNKPAEPSPPVIERKASSSQITVRAPTTLEVEVTLPQMSSPVIADAEIVPIDQRTESLSQENANDAATEEAVVPFATKELLMENVWKESVEEEPRKQSISLSVEAAPPQVPATVDVQSDAPAAALDDVEIKLLPSPSSNASPTPSKSSTMTEPKQNETYNERGVDVGTMENGHAEEENITHWTRRAASDWDVRQVGLWLVEMNLSQYVNNFKSHNVDGQALLRADGNRLKEYGVTDGDHRAEIKKRIKEFRQKLGKDSFNKGKSKDHKSARDKLQFWKGKYKVPH